MKNKKKIIAIIAAVGLALVLIGVTYAYWLVTKTQTNSNVISSACLDITLDNESAAISLENQYPLSDEDGMKLTPYTFTVTNKCNTSVDYQIALESLGEEVTSIKSSSIKAALDDDVRILSDGGAIATTISGAYESNLLGYGTLAAAGNEGSSKTYSLRIWIDENAPISEANKTFQSKISVTIGQGIKNPYVEGTMAYDILVNNGGAGVSVIDANEKADRISSSGSLYVGTTGNYQYGTEYTYDESTSKYVLGGEVVQAKLSECREGTKSCGKYTTKSTTTSNTTLYEILDFQTTGNYVSANTRKYTTAFAIPTTINDAGLYKVQDDLGDSYYFRGAVTDNYVQFGSYADDYVVYTLDDAESCWNDECVYPTLEDCESVANSDYDPEVASCVETTSEDAGKNMYWRIVRINGNGTIRLIYDGTTKVENGTSHRATIGNTTYNAEDYLNVNYGDSDIKGVVDAWYNTHLKTNYENYISDGIFCDDKEIMKVNYYDENGTATNADSAYHTNRWYAPFTRFNGSKNPRLTCTRKEDRYTKSTILGNGLLSYSIGLLTIDEFFYAGGTYSAELLSNKTFYLYSDENFWTSSPSHSYEDSDYAMMWLMYNDGRGSCSGNLDNVYGARPVINLRADVEFTGDGSYETPYVITTN